VRPARRPAAALARWSRPLAPVALGPRPHAPPHRTWIVQQFENCSTIVRARRSNVESRTPGARAERTRGRAPRGGRGAHQRVSPPPAATAHMRCGAVRCWVGLKGAGPLDPAPTTQAPDERAERARRSAASRGRSSGPGAFWLRSSERSLRRNQTSEEERSESRAVELPGGFPAVVLWQLNGRAARGLSGGHRGVRTGPSPAMITPPRTGRWAARWEGRPGWRRRRPARARRRPGCPPTAARPARARRGPRS